jgi:GH25 family lysozyme M1 (1,4-beta-N-acetylmuramidase)
MSRKFRKRRVGAVAAVVALASLGGLDIVLVTSHGAPVPELAAAAAAQATPAASSQVPATPSQGPAPAPTAPATVPVPTEPVVEKPTPVVGGVRRGNVGSAHSPKIQQQLASSPVTMPPPADAGALGVDVADHQHPHGAAIDWSQVAAAGYKFAFIKATEGDYYGNPYYASDLAAAKAAGLYATGYHFAIPNVSDGVSQADYAIANGGYAPDGRTLPLALDIEYDPYGSECYGLSPAQMVSWLAAFTGEVQRVTSQQPVIYTTADWWNTCTGDSTAFGADSLWVAAYRSDGPPMPAGWSNWTFWQYTSRASVPGITVNVDVSYFLQAAVRLLDPSDQRNAAGTAVQLQVTSLNAADGQSPQFTATSLPPGLSISGSGLIAGTIAPTATGTYAVTVNATSSSGATGSVSFHWTVTPKQPSTVPSSPAAPASPAGSVPASPSAPASPTPSGSASASPTASDSAPPPSDSPTPTPTPSDSSSAPPPSPSDSPTPTPTPTPTDPTPTEPPSVSPSLSDSASDSASPTGSATPAVSPSPTATT